jgi:asparagine synthase (glutamine-hydrolysing)
MCGIVGYFDYGGRGVVPCADTFDQMVDSLTHRGPDGRGTWFDAGVGLGHRRLSVLDPTAAGTQPMCSADASLVVTFNGEIYNFRELRGELIALGHRFRTNCDTEVLLAAYAEWGLAAVQRLNGMFSFALWDRARRRLWLARDRLGIKPLFFSLAGGMLRFERLRGSRAVAAGPRDDCGEQLGDPAAVLGIDDGPTADDARRS